MEAHSQLPWEVSEDSRGVPHIFAHVPEQKRLASGEQWSVATLDFCGWKPEEINANAAFIVRAANNHYQLLAALKAWSDYMDQLDRDSDPDDPLTKMRNEFHRKRIEMTRKAIADAERE